jgi:hypothetical protein
VSRLFAGYPGVGADDLLWSIEEVWGRRHARRWAMVRWGCHLGRRWPGAAGGAEGAELSAWEVVEEVATWA